MGKIWDLGKFSDNIALIDENGTELTYSQLNANAQALADEQDRLQWQYQELSELSPKENEWADLSAQYDILSHAADIQTAANNGYQLLNKTSGGQDGGKIGIAPNKQPKGYRDGLKQGRENARREIAALFTKYLKVEKTQDTKLAERAMAKWETFIKGESNG